VFAFFAPVVIYVQSSTFTIIAVTWYYQPYFGLVISYQLNMILFLFAFMRVTFVYQVFRYYRNRSSRRNTIAVGILVETVYYFGAYGPIILIPIPTPLMLLSALFFMRFRPVLEIE
jgi:hypothetical protein